MQALHKEIRSVERFREKNSEKKKEEFMKSLNIKSKIKKSGGKAYVPRVR